MYTRKINHPVQWMYKTAAALFLLAAGLQLALGNTLTGKVAAWVAAIVTLAATVSLVFRRHREELTRRAAEDKMVQNIQTYLTNVEDEPPKLEAGATPAGKTCGFQPLSRDLQPDVVDPDRLALNAMAPAWRAADDHRTVIDTLEPLPQTPML